MRLAEQPNVRSLFSGVMAIGAALLVKEDDPRLKLTHRPTIPILFLTNTSEIGPIKTYIANVTEQAEKDMKAPSGGDEVKVPALHLVTREGHNWTNPRGSSPFLSPRSILLILPERFRAFSTLVEWAFVGSLVTEYLIDGTKPGAAQPGVASLEKLSDGSALLKGKVLGAYKADNDLTTNFTVEDLHKAGIRLMSSFTIINAAGYAPFRLSDFC